MMRRIGMPRLYKALFSYLSIQSLSKSLERRPGKFRLGGTCRMRSPDVPSPESFHTSRRDSLDVLGKSDPISFVEPSHDSPEHTRRTRLRRTLDAFPDSRLAAFEN